jgi:hypothetical protein
MLEIVMMLEIAMMLEIPITLEIASMITTSISYMYVGMIFQ